MSALKKKIAPTSSGQHTAVRTYRAKIASIADSTLSSAQRLNERIDRVTRKYTPVPDRRREPPDDPRAEDEIPVDVVEESAARPSRP